MRTSTSIALEYMKSHAKQGWPWPGAKKDKSFRPFCLDVNVCRSTSPPRPVYFVQKLDELDDSLDFSEDDTEDYGTPASGAGPSPPSPPPSDFGDAGGGSSDAEDDLLGL